MAGIGRCIFSFIAGLLSYVQSFFDMDADSDESGADEAAGLQAMASGPVTMPIIEQPMMENNCSPNRNTFTKSKSLHSGGVRPKIKMQSSHMASTPHILQTPLQNENNSLDSYYTMNGLNNQAITSGSHWSMDGNLPNAGVDEFQHDIPLRPSPIRPSRLTTDYTQTPSHPLRAESSMVGASRQKEKKLPTFKSGNSIQFKQFLVKFEMTAVYNRWPHSDWILHLPLCLEGDALEVAMEAMGGVEGNISYENLVEALRKRFDPAERMLQYRSELRHRNRRQNESPEEYGAAVRRVFGMAYPNIPRDASEELLIDKYLEGLGDQELRKHTSLQEPKTLDEAITKVAQYEAVTKEVQDVRPKKPLPMPRQVNQISHQNKEINNNTEMSELMSMMSSLKNEVMEMKTKLTKLENTSVSNQKPRAVIRPWQPTSPRRNNEFSQVPQDVECYRCHKKGHMARYCEERLPGRSQTVTMINGRQPQAEGRATGENATPLLN